MNNTNTWPGTNPGGPQTASNYNSTNGHFKILDDSEVLPAATTASCGSTATSDLNGALLLGNSGFGIYWTGTVAETVTGGGGPLGGTTFPQGS